MPQCVSFVLGGSGSLDRRTPSSSLTPAMAPGRCNLALLCPHTDDDDSRRCRVVRRVVVGCRWGGGGRALSFSLEGVAADGLTPLFRSGLAHHAFLWLLLDVERPSSRLAELPPPGAEFAPRLECVVLVSLRARACFATTSSLRRCSSPLEGSGRQVVLAPHPRRSVDVPLEPSCGHFRQVGM